MPTISDKQWKSELAEMIANEASGDTGAIVHKVWKMARKHVLNLWNNMDKADLIRVY